MTAAMEGKIKRMRQTKKRLTSCRSENVLAVALVDESTRRSVLELESSLVALSSRRASSGTVTVRSEDGTASGVAHKVLHTVVILDNEEELATLSGINEAKNLLSNSCCHKIKLHLERLATSLALRFDGKRASIISESKLVSLAAVCHHHIARKSTRFIKWT